ncbi:hypothetical protein HDU97_006584 [Phlyctochytrium planicorne]|nr:hypothetical protein HDU97_006584 [Phlyctochytrium planicorne]
MSHQFVSVLFPTITKVIKQYTPYVWDTVFPASTAQRCPIQTTSFKVPYLPKEHLPQLHAWLGHKAAHSSYFLVRSPVLLSCEIPGILIGLLGFMLIERRFWTWRSAFLLFAGMNTVAMFCHNFTKPGTDPFWWAWALDVAFTGSSSFCLLLASIFHPFPISFTTPSTKSTKTTSRSDSTGAHLLYILGVTTLFTASILGIANKETRFIPWVPEVVYVAMTLLAASALAINVVLPALFSSVTDNGTATITGIGKIVLVLATGSILLGAAGLPLDKYLCEFQTSLGIVPDFNVSHMLFFGCDIAFLFLLAYVLAGVVPVGFDDKKDEKKKQ